MIALRRRADGELLAICTDQEHADRLSASVTCETTTEPAGLDVAAGVLRAAREAQRAVKLARLIEHREAGA